MSIHSCIHSSCIHSFIMSFAQHWWVCQRLSIYSFIHSSCIHSFIMSFHESSPLLGLSKVRHSLSCLHSFIHHVISWELTTAWFVKGQAFIHLFFYSFIMSFNESSPLFGVSKVRHLFLYSFIMSFNESSPLLLCQRSGIYSFFHLFIYSFIMSFHESSPLLGVSKVGHLFLFIYSFNHSSCYFMRAHHC